MLLPSSLVGAFCFPRARRDHSTSSGSKSSAGRARSQSSSVHSGESGSRVICRCISTSSSSVGMCISLSFANIPVPFLSARQSQADDAPSAFTPYVYNLLQLVGYQSESCQSVFAMSRAGSDDGSLLLEVLNRFKTESSGDDISRILSFIPFIYHDYIVHTIRRAFQAPLRRAFYRPSFAWLS